ncbi:hypothetical protein PO909_023412, partial [Leuciscus waleckii]
TPGPSGESLRKKTRKTDRSTPPDTPERKIARFTPAISPETSPDRRTLCPTPSNSPATSLDSVFLYAGSGRSPDSVISWNTPQRITWEQSSWTSEHDEVTTTNAGQSPYPFHSSPEEEEDIDVEEVPAAPHPTDEPLNDSPLTRRLINAIETLGQEFRDAQVDINNKYIELRDVQDDIITKLIALRSETQTETRSRLDALRGELLASHLETRSRFDTQDRFIQNLSDEIFRRIQSMQAAICEDFDRSGRMFTEYHRELVLLIHHLILVILDGTTE